MSSDTTPKPTNKVVHLVTPKTIAKHNTRMQEQMIAAAEEARIARQSASGQSTKTTPIGPLSTQVGSDPASQTPRVAE